MKKSILIAKMDEILEALSGQVTVDEARDGWTLEAKTKTYQFFAGVRQNVANGQPLPPMSISRALDHWGVIGGPILELAAAISNELRASKGI